MDDRPSSILTPGGLDIARTREEIKKAMEAHYQMIEKFCEEHRRHIQELRTRYNSLAPATCLPAEILSLIFEEYIAEYWRPSRLIDEPQTCCGETTDIRLAILHVCREWRRVALCTHLIWTCIVPMRKEYTELALAHSGRLPLIISTVSWGAMRRYDEMHGSYAAIIREFSRVRAAHFEVTETLRSVLSDKSQEHLGLEAPIMEELWVDMRSATFRLPALEMADMPLLNFLRIEHGSQALVASLARPTLTVLMIWLPPSVRATALIDVLEQLPLLEFLSLNCPSDDPPFPNVLLPLQRTITLRHLTYLSLTGDSPNYDMTQLLQCLIFPSYTAIKFHSYFPQEDHEQYTFVLPIVVSKALASETALTDASSTKFHPRVIAFDVRLLTVQLWSTILSRDTDIRPVRHSPPRLDLWMGTRDDDLFVHFFGLFDFTELSVMDAGINIPSEMWINALQGRVLAKLERVLLSRVSAEDFLEALTIPIPNPMSPQEQEDNQEPHARPENRYLLPDLKQLELYGLCFRARPGLKGENDMFPRIIALLLLRAERGFTLDKLKVYGSVNLTLEEDFIALNDHRIARSVEIGPSYVQDH